MNNQIPFFYPYNNFPMNDNLLKNIERLEEKIDYLEKEINSIKKMEDYNEDKIIEPSDMYMI